MDALLAVEVRNLSDRSLRRYSKEIDRGLSRQLCFFDCIRIRFLRASVFGANNGRSGIVFTLVGIRCLDRIRGFLVLAGGVSQIYKDKTDGKT